MAVKLDCNGQRCYQCLEVKRWFCPVKTKEVKKTPQNRITSDYDESEREGIKNWLQAG